LLTFKDILNPTEIAIIGLTAFSVAGWLAAIYVAYSSKFVVSPVEVLLAAITAQIKVPFVDSWLRGTLLSQRLLDAYWHRDKSIRLDEIACTSEVGTRDVSNTLTFKGKNDSRESIDCCPLLLIGGSVLSFDQFADSSTCMVTSEGRVPVRLRGILDSGHFQLAEMVFPTLLKHRDSFEIEHQHDWPGGMTPGTDIMWYPYAALFDRHVNRLTVKIHFPATVKYIRGYAANLSNGTCELAGVQPTADDTTPNQFMWELDSVDNQEIYVLVFDR